MNRLRVGLLALAITADCGSSRGTAELSGALTSTLGVDQAVGIYSSDIAVGVWQFRLGAASNVVDSSFLMGTPGLSLQTGTFTTSSAGTSCQITVTQVDSSAQSLSGNQWTLYQLTNPAVSAPPEGTFSFTINSTGAQVPYPGGSAWNSAHGTLSATLLPAFTNAASASGNVSVSVTF